MSLRSLKAAMRREVRSVSNFQRFDQARTRHPALADHETVMSVLAMLNDESRERQGHRNMITRALVREQQEHPHPFWSSVLLVAYFPMLSRLRGRIYGDALCANDLDQLVITAFLEIVQGFPVEHRKDWISVRLRQATQRRVFRKLRHEQRELERICPTEPGVLLGWEQELLDQQRHRAWPDTRPPKKRPPEPKECAELVDFLVEQVGDAIRADKLEPVIATLIRGQRLRAYVDQVYPDLEPSERQRAYERIKRRHSRTMARLREVLADSRCPRTDPAGALPNGTPELPQHEDEPWSQENHEPHSAEPFAMSRSA